MEPIKIVCPACQASLEIDEKEVVTVVPAVAVEATPAVDSTVAPEAVAPATASTDEQAS